jgi:hypothetical protein
MSIVCVLQDKALVGRVVVGAVAALAVSWTTSAFAQGFQDNTLSYRYGTSFKEPAVAGGANIEKSIVNFTHVDSYKYGSNFLSIDALFSNRIDPAAGGGAGAQEFYAVYRHDLSLNKVTGGKAYSFGPIRDIGLHAGGDANTKNTGFAPGKRLVVVGPYVSWAVPVGFLNTSVNYCKEWNHNGIVGKSVEFKDNVCFESAWSFPIPVGAANFKFNGFFNIIGPKGKDGFGNETKTEILARPELMLDVGEFFGKKNFVEAGVAYEYWSNKFGNDANKTVGAKANTPMFIGRAHF